MQRIKSFSVDHNDLPKGFYLSRFDKGVTTWDLRMCEPNVDEPMSSATAHTTEHILATYLRNSKISDKIIYVGPMGCLTGFYVLTVDCTANEILPYLREAFAYIKAFEGEIPGAKPEQCGNYSLQDVNGARDIAAITCEVLENCSDDTTEYPKMLD